MPEYKVGYKKPPKGSQWKKGQSGNSKGRPKGKKSLTTIGLDMFHKPVTVLQNGKAIKISMIDAVRAKLLATAMKGDLKAMKLVFDQYSKLASGSDSKSMADLVAAQSPFVLTAEDEANIAKFKLLEGVK
jgi:hypothetical protein